MRKESQIDPFELSPLAQQKMQELVAGNGRRWFWREWSSTEGHQLRHHRRVWASGRTERRASARRTSHPKPRRTFSTTPKLSHLQRAERLNRPGQRTFSPNARRHREISRARLPLPDLPSGFFPSANGAEA